MSEHPQTATHNEEDSCQNHKQAAAPATGPTTIRAPRTGRSRAKEATGAKISHAHLIFSLNQNQEQESAWSARCAMILCDLPPNRQSSADNCQCYGVSFVIQAIRSRGLPHHGIKSRRDELRRLVDTPARYSWKAVAVNVVPNPSVGTGREHN